MIGEVVDKYLDIYPEDRSGLDLLLEQLRDGDKLDDRRNFRGHIAGDAVIFSPDLTKILYIYHKRFNNLQQPGGHLEPNEEGPWETAPREGREETGVRIARLVGPDVADLRIPLHIVTGNVSPSDVKKEPTHKHHDFRYGMVAETEELDPTNDDGVEDVRWVPINEALKTSVNIHNIHKSILRMRSLL